MTSRKRTHPATAPEPAEQEPTEVVTAESLTDDITRLTDGLARFGVNFNLSSIDLNNLHARVEATAALKLLIAAGVCTEEAAMMACQIEMRTILAAVLQIVEEQALREAKSIQKVQRPPIQIARLRD